MARGKARVEVDLSALRKLRQHPESVLRELDLPCRDEARRALDIATFLVPVGDPTDDSNLRETAFLSGPVYNLGPLSTTWISGFNHPQAGAIHAGFHWGWQTEDPPPDFMRKAFRGARGRARKSVAAQLMRALSKFFPTH